MTPEAVAVLLINGRDPTAQRLACFLAAEGMRVTAVGDVVTAQLEIQSRTYDCLVLDLGRSPDAASITQRLRTHCGAPVAFIAPTNDVNERVNALDAGADDCVATPFSERELMLRILASVRRARSLHLRP